MALVVKFFKRTVLNEILYAKNLLDLLGFDKGATFSIYETYPNVSQGQLLADIDTKDFPQNIEGFIQKQNKHNRNLQNLIYQFNFKTKLDKDVFDGYIRVNSDYLSSVFGNIELDIFPKKDIGNFGDYIATEKGSALKEIIYEWVTKYSKINKIPIKEAYIGVSIGDFRFDNSKRVWFWYRYEKDLLMDTIRFIKNVPQLDIPEYLKKEYLPMLNQLAPYSEGFIAKEFSQSDDFHTLFNDFTKENSIDVRKGSLLLNMEDTEATLHLLRYLSEKIIFPVMEKVIGGKDFKKLVGDSLKKQIT